MTSPRANDSGNFKQVVLRGVNDGFDMLFEIETLES